MSTSPGQSIKHAIIEQTNTAILTAIGIATFLVIFALFASKALISQSLYHQRVISEKEDAVQVLKENKRKAEELRTSYDSFATETINVLGGAVNGDGPLDGDNAKLVLDALPSVYDYPALSSSLEKILIDGNYAITAIGGSEDSSLSAGGNEIDPETGEPTSVAGIAPEPVVIPYPFTVQASPESGLKLLETLERSIRPFKIESINVSGQANNLDMRISLSTYYKPPTSLQVTTKVVK